MNIAYSLIKFRLQDARCLIRPEMIQIRVIPDILWGGCSLELHFAIQFWICQPFKLNKHCCRYSQWRRQPYTYIVHLSSGHNYRILTHTTRQTPLIRFSFANLVFYMPQPVVVFNAIGLKMMWFCKNNWYNELCVQYFVSMKRFITSSSSITSSMCRMAECSILNSSSQICTFARM